MFAHAFEWVARLLFNAFVSAIQKRRQGRPQSTPTMTAEDQRSAVVIGNLLPSARHPAEVGPVWLRFITRLRHFLITGQVGSGKTNLIRLLLQHDLKQGNGVFVIDPRGEFVDLILQILAEQFTWEELEPRLVLIDIRQHSAFGSPKEWVVVVNLLLQFGGDPYATVAFIMELLRQMWGELGVQIQYDFQHILLALALSPSGPFSVLDAPLVLTDVRFRARVIAGIEDPLVLRYFEQVAHMKDVAGQARALSNKISPLFAGSERERETVGGTQKSYSIRSHFEQVENPIVLVCPAADEIGSNAAGILAALFLSAAIKAVMRSDRAVTEEPTHGVHFVLDELASYAGGIEEPLGQLIREGRKFGAYCTLSLQTPSSLSVSIRNLLLDVCGTMCFFAQGPQQADTVAGWVQSDELPRPLVRQFLGQARSGEALLLRQGHMPRRMQALFAPYPKVDAAKVRALRKAALERWGVPRQTATVHFHQSGAEPHAVATPAPETEATAHGEPSNTPLEAREVDEAPRVRRRRRPRS